MAYIRTRFNARNVTKVTWNYRYDELVYEIFAQRCTQIKYEYILPVRALKIMMNNVH